MTNFAKKILSDDVSNIQSKFTELPVANSGFRGQDTKSMLQTLFQNLKPATLCLALYTARHKCDQEHYMFSQNSVLSVSAYSVTLCLHLPKYVSFTALSLNQNLHRHIMHVSAATLLQIQLNFVKLLKLLRLRSGFYRVQ